MKKAIAMRCTREQFETIILKFKNCQIADISVNFNFYCYLVNNFRGINNNIANVATGYFQNTDREVFEEWNEKVFLEACGIKTTPSLEEVKKRYENAAIIKDAYQKYEFNLNNFDFESLHYWEHSVMDKDVYIVHRVNKNHIISLFDKEKGFAEIITYKKPIRTNKLTELEKRVEVLEAKQKQDSVINIISELLPIHSPEQEMKWRIENRNSQLISPVFGESFNFEGILKEGKNTVVSKDLYDNLQVHLHGYRKENNELKARIEELEAEKKLFYQL